VTDGAGDTAEMASIRKKKTWAMANTLFGAAKQSRAAETQSPQFATLVRG